MQKKRKKIVVIFVIILIFILSVILYYKLNLDNNIQDVLCNISDINEAYDVKICTNKFYNFCKDYRDTNPSSIIELLDNDYLKEYDVTEKNLYENVESYDSDCIQIDEVYKMKERGNVALYIVKAKLLYENSEIQKNFNIIIKLDKNNRSFSVFLENYIEDKGYMNLKLGDKVNVSLKTINQNSSNTYDQSERKITDNVEDIFADYANNCIFYEKRAYELIDEECKKSKYSNYDIFDKYITDNLIDIVTMELQSYVEEKKDDYIEYRCKSNKGQIYIFKVTSYLTYTVTIE